MTIIPLAVLIDWVSKSWAIAALGDDFIPLGVFGLMVVRNDAFVFSSGSGVVVAEAVIVARIIALGLIILTGLRLSRSMRDVLGFSLLLAGTLGNIVDILFRGGAVVDFITTTPSTFLLAGDEVDLVFVFNIADIFVALGVILTWPLIRSLAKRLNDHPRPFAKLWRSLYPSQPDSP